MGNRSTVTMRSLPWFVNCAALLQPWSNLPLKTITGWRHANFWSQTAMNTCIFGSWRVISLQTSLCVQCCRWTIAKLLISVFRSSVVDGKSLFSLQSSSQVLRHLFFLPSGSIYCRLLLNFKMLTHVSRNQCGHLMVQLTNVLGFCLCVCVCVRQEPASLDLGPGGAREMTMISISVENPPWSGRLQSD